MNDEEKQLLQAQINLEKWAAIKHIISNNLCIGCGGDSDIKLYVHFCNQCLLDAGVKIEFLQTPEAKSEEHPPPNIDMNFKRFMWGLYKPKEKNEQ